METRIKTKWIIYILFITLYTSCTNNGILKDNEIPQIKKLILSKGDQAAYIDLMIYYEDKMQYEALLPYSIIMANKYDNANAYYQIYFCIMRIYNNGQFDYKFIKNLDLDSRKFVLDNLQNSAQLGDNSAKEYLAKYYAEGVYLPKNIELAKKLEEETKVKVGP
jgi:hypothetical protein